MALTSIRIKIRHGKNTETSIEEVDVMGQDTKSFNRGLIMTRQELQEFIHSLIYMGIELKNTERGEIDLVDIVNKNMLKVVNT